MALALTLAAGGCGKDATVADDGTVGSTGGKPTTDAGPDAIVLADTGESDAPLTCTPACPEGQFCSHGVCVTQTSCADNDECQNDTHCEPATGCVPWKPGESDETCQVGLPPGNFAPAVKCEFSKPPANDPFPNHVDVQATPMVVSFAPKSGGTPSIIVPFTATVPANYTEDLGVIRVLRGDDCTLEQNLGAGHGGFSEYVVSSSPVAVGDLDGDGVAEIVARAASGKFVAFTKKTDWTTLWVSPTAVRPACDPEKHRCSGGGWAGPSIHDLDDDGVPEIISEGDVLDGTTGAVKGPPPAEYASYGSGLNPVLADLDLDGAIELTNGAYVWGWDRANDRWALEVTFTDGAPGFTAVADFGAYGSGSATQAEIVVVRNDTVRIYAGDGTVVLAPVTVPGLAGAAAGGGAPTVADYDGDGLPEVGVAGRAFLTVYDLDCSATPRATGKCDAGRACDDASQVPGACPPGILWSRRTQDESSNVTGSSVFDFEGDGRAEVVYGDECFVRVYDGLRGEVIFSQFRSSCTWFENPIVADTDGNFRADLVNPSNRACAPAGLDAIACKYLDQGVDQQFSGLRCKASSDCVSGKCDAGLCRCATTADCCSDQTDAACVEQGFQCAAPPANTAGSGNTCRAGHPHGVSGIRVYSDSQDRWVRSRTIWNQHAYAVTHVNEDGTIPKTSAWKANWQADDLNNFRQNVPGTANGQATPDLTAAPAAFACVNEGAKLAAPLCNRGAEAVGRGISVGFYDGTTAICTGTTSVALAPGECTSVSCIWGSPPTDSGRDVTVRADDRGDRTECREANNQGVIPGVFCKSIE